jgi:aspartate aminotransferase/aminotransferase
MQVEAKARGETLPAPIRLQIGEPSFRTPEHIRQAAMQAIESEPMTYGPAAGWSWLRELLAAKIRRVNEYSVAPSNIAVTMGGTGGIQAVFNATLGAGNEVLLPNPCWSHYFMQLAVCGAAPVSYLLDPQSGWLPDIAHLEKLITPRTRMLLINTPGNPTGAVFTRQLVSDLLDFARRHDLYLLSDECYDELVFEGEHISPATLMTENEFENGCFIGIYTFSKTYAMTGWRIGYVVTGRSLLKTITDVLNAGQTNISTLVQRAAAAALTGPQDCVGEMREAYRHNRDLTVSLLKDYGRYVYTPHGAFYALIDISRREGEAQPARQFALDLLKQHNIMVAPGTGFGSVAEACVRISLAASAQDIERGVREICEFANN